MAISTISPQSTSTQAMLLQSLTGTGSNLMSALNSAIQKSRDDAQIRFNQEKNFLNEQQKNIENDRIERFNLDRKAEFALKFGEDRENNRVNRDLGYKKFDLSEKQFDMTNKAQGIANEMNTQNMSQDKQLFDRSIELGATAPDLNAAQMKAQDASRTLAETNLANIKEDRALNEQQRLDVINRASEIENQGGAKTAGERQLLSTTATLKGGSQYIEPSVNAETETKTYLDDVKAIEDAFIAKEKLMGSKNFTPEIGTEFDNNFEKRFGVPIDSGTPEQIVSGLRARKEQLQQQQERLKTTGDGDGNGVPDMVQAPSSQAAVGGSRPTSSRYDQGESKEIKPETIALAQQGNKDLSNPNVNALDNLGSVFSIYEEKSKKLAEQFVEKAATFDNNESNFITMTTKNDPKSSSSKKLYEAEMMKTAMEIVNTEYPNSVDFKDVKSLSNVAGNIPRGIFNSSITNQLDLDKYYKFDSNESKEMMKDIFEKLSMLRTKRSNEIGSQKKNNKTMKQSAHVATRLNQK